MSDCDHFEEFRASVDTTFNSFRGKVCLTGFSLNPPARQAAKCKGCSASDVKDQPCSLVKTLAVAVSSRDTLFHTRGVTMFGTFWVAQRPQPLLLRKITRISNGGLQPDF